MGVASLLGRLATGWLLDRFFAPRLGFCVLAVAALGIFILSSAHSLFMGSLAAILVGFGMGGEADMTPYILSRYFGLRSFSMLYGFTWTGYAIAGAIGPVLMGRAFDTTASYQALAVKLSVLTLFAAGLMLVMPSYSAYAGRPLPPPPFSGSGPDGSAPGRAGCPDAVSLPAAPAGPCSRGAASGVHEQG